MTEQGASLRGVQLTRRHFLNVAAAGACGLALLSACGGQTPARITGAASVASSTASRSAAGSTAATSKAAGTTTAASAGGPTPAPTRSAVVSVGKGSKKLTFWNYFGGLNGEVLAKVVEGYTTEHPEFSIELDTTPTGQLLQKLQTAIAGNSTPDVAQTDLVWVPIMIATQATVALDPYLKQAKVDPADFFDSLRQYDQAEDGTYYALPLDTDTAQLFYNKSLVQQAGLDFEKQPPRTWAELLDVAQKLTDPNKQQWGVDLGVQVTQGTQGALTNRHMILTWQSGSNYFGAKNGRPERGAPLFNNDAGVTAWQWNVDMVHKYKVTPPSPPSNGFTSGREAIYYNGDWAITSTLQQIGRAFELGTMPFPGPTADQDSVCWSGGEHVQAFHGKNQDDAVQFLLWLTSPATIESFNTQTGYIPTRQSVINGKSYQQWLTQNPLYKVYADSMPKTHPRVPTSLFTELTNAISLELEKPLKQTATVKDALDAAVQDCKAIMQQAGYQT